ncbi:chemotaxis protein CheB [Bacillus licheniformis]|nr:chemotaxis protein CheB [Bacillus licheniformis]
MTGMGSDGTEGVKGLLKHGSGTVIAEAAESSVVSECRNRSLTTGLQTTSSMLMRLPQPL